MKVGLYPAPWPAALLQQGGLRCPAGACLPRANFLLHSCLHLHAVVPLALLPYLQAQLEAALAQRGLSTEGGKLGLVDRLHTALQQEQAAATSADKPAAEAAQAAPSKAAAPASAAKAEAAAAPAAEAKPAEAKPAAPAEQPSMEDLSAKTKASLLFGGVFAAPALSSLNPR